MQMAQAAPAPASSGDPIADVFRRLPPQQQAWYARALKNPTTQAAAMARLQAMVKQDKWTTTQAPNGQLIQTNERGEIRPVQGYDKKLDAWQWQQTPDGGMIGFNAANGDAKRISGPDTTALIKEYEFSRARGENPGSFVEFIQKRAEAQRAQTNVINNMPKADSKAAETAAVEFTKELVETRKDGQNARGDLARIRQLRTQIDKLPGGFVGGVQAFANRFGVKLGPNPDAVEAATAIINQLVPQQRPAGSGTMSDRDVDLFKSSLPQLSNTKEGNKLILDTMEALAVYRQRQSAIAARVLSEKITRAQAMEELDNLPDPFEQFRNETGTPPDINTVKPGQVIELAPGVTIRQK